MTAHPIRSEIDLLSGQFWAGDHHEAFTWMRAEAPVYFDPNSQLWAVTRYDDLKAVSTDPRRFSSAQGIRPESGPLPMMIDMDDPAHLRRRKLVNRGFTPRRVREQRSEVLAACDEIIDAICERGSADFVADIAAPLPMIMIGDALGVAPEDRRELLQWSDDMLSSLTGDIERARTWRRGVQRLQRVCEQGDRRPPRVPGRRPDVGARPRRGRRRSPRPRLARPGVVADPDRR